MNASDVYLFDNHDGQWTATFVLGAYERRTEAVSADDALAIESVAGPMHQFDTVATKVRKLRADPKAGPFAPGNRCLEIKLYPAKVPSLSELKLPKSTVEALHDAGRAGS